MKNVLLSLSLLLTLAHVGDAAEALKLHENLANGNACAFTTTTGPRWKIVDPNNTDATFTVKLGKDADFPGSESLLPGSLVLLAFTVQGCTTTSVLFNGCPYWLDPSLPVWTVFLPTNATNGNLLFNVPGPAILGLPNQQLALQVFGEWFPGQTYGSRVATLHNKFFQPTYCN